MCSLWVQNHPYFNSFCYGMLVMCPLLFWLFHICCSKYKVSSSTANNIPPGSVGLPFIGNTLQFMAAVNSSKGVYEFVRSCRLRCGNCFKTKIFGETHVFVSSTESAKAILNNEMGKFTKRYIKSIAELVGHNSLLCSPHPQHKIIRGRLLNLFSPTSLSSFIKQFDQLVVETLSTWDDRGGTVFILEEALKVTCKAMCKMLISMESGPELEMMQKEVARLCEAMLAFPLKLPWMRFYKGLQARRKIMDLLERMIRERRRGGAEACIYQDFLQRLLMAESDRTVNGTADDGSPILTDAEIKDNILTMIIAGQDTTASAITWLVKFLDENQHVLDTIREEQYFVLKNKASTKSFLTLEDLNEMPYASKVVKESLRMASIVQWLPRLALQDCEIEGFKINRGWNINIDARSIHLDPSVYNDPYAFNPSRFDAEPKPYSFLAFGMGGRTCLGVNMAKAMMLVFLHRLTTTYKWEVIDSDSSVEKLALFSKLKSGCPVHLRRVK